ncbi:MAG: hypothetical protein M3Q60_15805 [Actinomycetota bacterium]|nr:hypothetical protein [Actinomycetota bacterium]
MRRTGRLGPDLLHVKQPFLGDVQDGQRSFVPEFCVAPFLRLGGRAGADLLAQRFALGIVRRPTVRPGDDSDGLAVGAADKMATTSSSAA